MQIRRLSMALILSLAFPLAVARAGNPIPGVGIVVKKCNCVTCCTSVRLVIPGGFFGPGSDPFTGSVAMEGNSEGHPDGRIDYAADAMTGPFEMSMQHMTLFTSEPIQISAGGAISLYDVQCVISGPAPEADDPIPGVMSLPPGEELVLALAKDVRDGTIDGRCVFTFFEHTTGEEVATPIEMDLHLELQDVGLPVTLVEDGTPTGQIVLGFDGITVVPFTFASADSELVIQMISLYAEGPVATEPSTWGRVKVLYR